MKSVDAVFRDALMSLTDNDWWGIEVILGPAEEVVGDDGPEFRKLVVEVLDRLLSEDLAQFGHFSRLYAVEESSPELRERIIADLVAHRWEPRGQGYWLVGTDKGKELGRMFVRHEREAEEQS